ASLYLPAGARGPAFLLFDNFRVIMKYNNAASYALAVGLLADRMGGAGPVAASWPRDERALSRAERQQFPNDLNTLGSDPGDSVGVLVRKPRSPLKLYQKPKASPPMAFPPPRYWRCWTRMPKPPPRKSIDGFRKLGTIHPVRRRIEQALTFGGAGGIIKID